MKKNIIQFLNNNLDVELQIGNGVHAALNNYGVLSKLISHRIQFPRQYIARHEIPIVFATNCIWVGVTWAPLQIVMLPQAAEQKLTGAQCNWFPVRLMDATQSEMLGSWLGTRYQVTNGVKEEKNSNSKHNFPYSSGKYARPKPSYSYFPAAIVLCKPKTMAVNDCYYQ